MRLRRALVPLLATACVASLGLNVVLFQQGQVYFHAANAVRLDPVGASVYPVDETAPEGLPANPGQRRVVFFGDSRALMWTPPADLSGVEIINRGIGNQTTAQILERLDRHVRPTHPSVVVLEAGVNDLKMIPLFPDRREAIVHDCTKNLEEIIRRLRGLGATVVVSTVFPLGKVPLDRKPFWSDDVARSIEEVNASLRALASRADHVALFDAYPLLLDTHLAPPRLPEVLPDYSMDLLHLNPHGYEALNAKLVPLLIPLAVAP